MRVLDPNQNLYIPESTLEYADAPGDEFPVRAPGGAWFVLRPLTGATRRLGEGDEKLLAQIALQEALHDQPEKHINQSLAVPLEEGLDDKHILKAVFVIGSGGAGKSGVAKEMFSGSGLKVVNQDNHLERLIKKAGVPLDMIGTRYDLLKKSQKLKDVELRGYANARLGLIVDSTGWDYPRVATPAQKLRDLGYDIYLVYVTTSHETAQRRNKQRGQAGGRFVPEPYIRDAHFGALQNFPRYKKLFGKANTFVVDNDKDLSPEQFQKEMGPRLRRLGRTILAKPLKNPKGKQWRETARQTLSDPTRKKDWQKPKPPPMPKIKQQPIGKIDTRRRARKRVSKSGKGQKVTGGNVRNMFNLFLTGKADGNSPYGKAKKRVTESLHCVNTTVPPPGSGQLIENLEEHMPREQAVKVAWLMHKKSKA